MMTKIFLFLATIIPALTVTAQNTSSSTFIPKCPSEIYLGRVMEAPSMNKSKYEYCQTPFKSITVSFSIPAKSVSISPTKEAMMTAAQEAVKAKTFSQNQEFSFSGKEINNYDILKLLFGQEISLPS